ncbi:MAG: hypothetical protein ACYSRR_06940 [Planctomycetota bacterium]
MQLRTLRLIIKGCNFMERVFMVVWLGQGLNMPEQDGPVSIIRFYSTHKFDFVS